MDSKSKYITGAYPISRDESAAIKGLVIILIVLGHCKGIVENPINNDIWLYSFHVQIFFILPWIYPFKEKTMKDLFITSVIRLLIPYVIFYTLSFILFNAVMPIEGERHSYFSAFFSASPKTIQNTVGIVAIWFLPVFFVYTILIYFIRKHSKYALVILAIVIVAYILNSYTSLTKDTELFIWLKYLTTCISCSIMTCYALSIRRPVILTLAIFVFSVSTIVIYIEPTFFKVHLRFLTIISAFIIIYHYRTLLSRSKALKEFGKYSLSIYLLHIYFVKLCESKWGKESIGWGIVTFFIALMAAYLFSVVIYKIKFIRKLIFPNSIEDIKSFTYLKKEMSK